MAYSVLTSRSAGDPGLASDWNANKANWDAVFNSSGKILAGSYVANSIAAADLAADSVGSSEIATDAVGQAEIAASAVGQGELKVASEEQSGSGGAGVWLNFVMSSGAYAFYPQIKSSSTGANDSATIANAIAESASYRTIGARMSSSARTSYFSQVYVTASPPYPFAGESDWGQFCYLLRNDSDGSILRSWTAPDPPWAWRARQVGVPKGHPGAPGLRPDPFSEVLPDGIPAGHSIVMVDLRDFNEKAPARPRMREYEALVQQRGELLAQGLPEVLVDEHEGLARVEMEAEAARISEWEKELGELPETTAAAIDGLAGNVVLRHEVFMSRPTHSAEHPDAPILNVLFDENRKKELLLVVIEETRPKFSAEHSLMLAQSIQRKAVKREAWLRHHLEARTALDTIAEDAEAKGSSLLQEINESPQFKVYREADRTLLASVGGSAVRVVTR